MKRRDKYCSISSLRLYTQLIVVIYGSLGLNLLLCYLYGKYVLYFEFSTLILILSILMFVCIPITLFDPKKENKSFIATVFNCIMHGICTIVAAILLHFEVLLLVYLVEILGFVVFYNKISKK